MEVPVFTIIIPTLNAAKTLHRAMDSLLNQTYRNFELWALDAVSTDNTVAILKDYSASDDRVHFISEKDDGIFDAMNKGIRLATGTWIYFLGSDDRLMNPEVLEKVFAETKTGQFDLIYGFITSRKYGRYGGPVGPKDLLKKNISHQAMFFNRKVFEKTGYYNTRYRTHSDWEFNFRLFMQADLQAKYIELNIADYSTDGASAVHEVPFLREVLLPKHLELLNADQSDVHTLSGFDACWRFFRNAKVRNLEDLLPYITEGQIPYVVRMIIRVQQKLSPQILGNGYLSKFFMATSFSRFLLHEKLNNNP